MVKMNLGALIKKRGMEGKAIREIAEESGIDHVSLWKMIKNKPYNPSLEMINKLCEFFKCQPGELLIRVKGNR